ncbi:MAG: hypothetical protein J6S14_03605 [Clostridia bacterium]|nr:hypothetical protein [Clostridia bacterium]
MKTRTKALLLALSAVLLVVSTVMATMAYLTYTTQTVQNTFTVGQVVISLDESVVSEYGVATSERTKTGNQYKLIPGHTYDKDPTITVETGSEECWVFAKLDDGLGEASAITINEGWTQMTTTDGSLVYAYNTKMNVGDTATLFEEFTFAGNADPDAYKSASINVTAYAIQADGFTTAALAWAAAPATWTNNN